MRILIVDDDPIVGRSLARVLRDHTVVFEVDPKQALNRVEEGRRDGAPFDVLLCDQLMPGTNGRDIAAAVRRDPEGPIAIVMSGDATILDSGCGADGVLLKPFRSTDLLGVVQNATRRRMQQTTRRIPIFA